MTSFALQRGRELTLAESVVDGGTERSRIVLQRGRELTLAERWLEMGGQRPFPVLQRGRELTLAESSAGTWARAAAARFNGAAN